MSTETITLDMTMRALLAVALKGLKIEDQVDALVSAGWSNGEISSLTGMSSGAIGMRKLRAKGKGKKHENG